MRKHSAGPLCEEGYLTGLWRKGGTASALGEKSPPTFWADSGFPALQQPAWLNGAVRRLSQAGQRKYTFRSPAIALKNRLEFGKDLRLRFG